MGNMHSSTPDTALRYVGYCPICEGDFKLRAEGLVHHGYRRPGVGYIVGDCFAVGSLPYELSAQVCRTFRDHCAQTADQATAFLARLRNGEVRSLTYRKPAGYARFEEVTVSADSEDPREWHLFTQELNNRIHRVEHEIQFYEREIDRMTQLIADWTLRPIRTVDELVRRGDAAKATRQTEREAKRQAREAKLVASKAKAAEREQAKQALITHYREIFMELAADATSLPERKRIAREHWVAMHRAMDKRAFLHFYPRSLDCNDALLTLGLARLDHQGVMRDGIFYVGPLG